MATDHEFYMRRCLELARKAEAIGEVPVGAVVVLDNDIIGEGFNQPISRSDPTAHAEIVALRDAAKRMGNYRLPNSTVYVTIEPCTMCAGSMVQARISELVYGADEPRSGAVSSHKSVLDGEHLNHRIEYRGGVLAEECGALIREFFRAKRQK